MRAPSLSAVLVGLLAATVAVLSLQSAGTWGGPDRAAPPPPTPAALAFRAGLDLEAGRRADAARQAAQIAALQAATEEPSALPDGHGRDETFGRCTPCHTTALVRRSRLSREGWDALMTWMTEKQGMEPLLGEERALIVGYLAGAFPETAPGGSGAGGADGMAGGPNRRPLANPFL